MGEVSPPTQGPRPLGIAELDRRVHAVPCQIVGPTVANQAREAQREPMPGQDGLSPFGGLDAVLIQDHGPAGLEEVDPVQIVRLARE